MQGVFDTTVAVITSDEVRRGAGRGARARACRRARGAPARSGGEGGPGRARGRERRHASRTWSGRCPPCSQGCGDEAEGRADRRQAPAPARRRRGRCCRHRCVGAPRSLRRRFDKAIQELTLPLRHEDVIRQQAEREGRRRRADRGGDLRRVEFRDQTSHAGARGLMQITPDDGRNEIERLQRRHHLQARGPRRPRNQHPLRDLLPARTARPLRRQTRSRRWPPTTPGRPTSTSGVGRP